MKKLFNILLFLIIISYSAGCQPHRKLRKHVGLIDSVDEALYLKKKYPKSEIEIHKLHSITFFNHNRYSCLKPGVLMRIGQENSKAANLYKLLRVVQSLNKSQTLQYNVLQVRLK